MESVDGIRSFIGRVSTKSHASRDLARRHLPAAEVGRGRAVDDGPGDHVVGSLADLHRLVRQPQRSAGNLVLDVDDLDKETRLVKPTRRAAGEVGDGDALAARLVSRHVVGGDGGVELAKPGVQGVLRVVASATNERANRMASLRMFEDCIVVWARRLFNVPLVHRMVVEIIRAGSNERGVYDGV